VTCALARGNLTDQLMFTACPDVGTVLLMAHCGMKDDLAVGMFFTPGGVTRHVSVCGLQKRRETERKWRNSRTYPCLESFCAHIL
jgi:hypothetical protein